MTSVPMHILNLGLALKGMFLPQQLRCALQGHSHVVFDAVTQAASVLLCSLYLSVVSVSHAYHVF
jgi:hypothetical protein